MLELWTLNPVWGVNNPKAYQPEKLYFMLYSEISFLFLQLVLRDNDIVEIPKEIYKCQKLKTLHLQVNQINVLPPEISETNVQ